MLEEGDPPPGCSCPAIEPAAVEMNRFLRPAHILRSGGATWLVDESWPVAARVADDGAVSLTSWPWPEDRVDPGVDRVVLADSVGIVAAHGRQLAWVRRDGCTVVQVDDHLTLSAADPDAAWFADMTSLRPAHPTDAPLPLSPGRIVAMHRDGSSTQLDTPAPVLAIDLDDTDVWVTLAEPPVMHPAGNDRPRIFEYPTIVLRATRAGLLADGLAAAAPTADDVPERRSARPSSHRWLDEEADIRGGVPAGGLVWSVGSPVTADKIDRQVVVIGGDPADGRRSVRVDLGSGLARDVQAVGDELWVVVTRGRRLAVAHDRGVDVMAVSVSGAVRTVHRADSIDISSSTPSLLRPPEQQIRDHIDGVRGQFGDLNRYWRHTDGTVSPLSDGLTDGSVSVEGEWPTAAVVVTMRHAGRPGLLLRRTLPLFDGRGSPVEHRYAALHLMEDLDTDYIAPADEAVDGVLDT